MYETGSCEGIILTESDAREAIELLAGLKRLHLFEEVISGAERLSESIHSVPTRGFQEVVQNAEDQCAKSVRFGFRKRGAGPGELLIAHDGSPVVLEDVLRMAVPLVSGSRGDSGKIGQFGVGLRTLRRFGRRMEVHCRPLPSFAIKDGQIHTAKSESPIKGFWNADARETLFVLQLEDKSVTLDFLETWLSDWDSSSLLFLDHVCSVELMSLGRGCRTVKSCAVRRGESKPSKFELARAVEIREQVVSESSSKRRWTRYVARFKTPRRLRDPGDGLGENIDVRVAVPNRAAENRLYVGLPLEEDNSLPYALGSRHFRLSVDRTDLLEDERNSWLIGAAIELGTAVARSRLLRSPKTAWRSVILTSESCGNSPWVRQQFSEAIARQWRDLTRRGSVRVKDLEIRLDNLVYEIRDLEGILDPADLARLWREKWNEEVQALPKNARDGGRWREVLSDEHCGARQFDFEEAICVFRWDDGELDARGDQWMVELTAAGLRNDLGHHLEDVECIPLAEGAERVSPRQVLDRGLLLVHTTRDDGLAASLGLAERICTKLRARSQEAELVRAWLIEIGVLQKKANSAAALRALARGDGSHPRDLSSKDQILIQLKHAFDQLPAEERAELGVGLGENMLLDCFEYKSGRKRVSAMKPAEAYLPGAFGSGPFSRAAGKTPGLAWVQPRYRELLSGVRGQGALAFLRSLGAASAPRLVAAEPPGKGPHLPPLIGAGELCAQHLDELSDLPRVTGLRHDHVSPDADRVAADIKAVKKLRDRRSRARDLVLTFEERWPDFQDKISAQAVLHYYSFEVLGEVSASWLARLASQKWMTTREPGLNPAAPRDLSVLTETTFEIEGADRSRYSGELQPDDAGLPIVSALGIRGSRKASDVIEQLKQLKLGGGEAGPDVQNLAERCLFVLEEFASGGRLESESDLTDEEIRNALTDPGRKGGLIYAAEGWHSPTEVRLGPAIHPSLPCTNLAPGLMRAIGVRRPTAAECIKLLQEISKDDSGDRTAEFRVFERLLEVEAGQSKGLMVLKRAPLRLTTGWTTRRGEEPIFATPYSALTEALGRSWRVWDPPMPMARLGRLVDRLGVVPLDQDQLLPDIPPHLLEQDFDQQDDFDAAVGRFRTYLTTHHVELHARVGGDAWRMLKETKVVVGTEWSLKVTVSGKRAQRVRLLAHHFSDPNVLCVADEDQLGLRDGAGQAIASKLGGTTASESDLSTLSLVWAETFKSQKSLDFSIDPFEEPEPTPGLDEFENFIGSAGGNSQSGKNKKRATRRRQPTKKEPGRHLHEFDELDLTQIQGVMVAGKGKGETVRVKHPQKTKTPKRGSNGGSKGQGGGAGTRAYTDEQRETLAFEIVSHALADRFGLSLDDIRDQRNVGADAVDRERDVWVELKAHGKDMPISVRLEPSEYLRAEEKRSNYLLAVVWGLETGRKPDFVLIHDPIHRLDRVISSRVQLRGIDKIVDEARKP
jgi:hypothetical protein